MNERLKSPALLFTAPGVVRVGTIELPPLAADEVLVKTAWSCISPGTEARCLAGKQDGAPPWPFIPGYALTGVVVAAGKDAGLLPGAAVFCQGTKTRDVATCWGGHTGHAVAAASAVYPLPEGIDLKTACLAKLAAIAWHGVKLGGITEADRVAVVGLGILGQLAARLCRMTGAEVWASDRISQRMELARSAAIHTFDGVDKLRELVPDGVDVVIDVTGAPALLSAIPELLKDKPWDDTQPRPSRVIVQGSYPGTVAVPYDAFFMKEASLLFPRDSQPRDIREVIGFMAEGRLQVNDLISRTAAPADAASLYAVLADPESGTVGCAVDWRD